MTVPKCCPVCGERLPRPAGTGRRQGRPRRWCSPKCRYAARGRSAAEMRARRAERDRINAHFPKEA